MATKTPKIIPVREQIADALRSDIISGELEANTKLNEQQLAERFGVSRGPIRDVLLKLTKEGLLVSKNNVGSSVNSPLSPEMQKLSIELRRKIEEFAVKTCMPLVTDKDIEALEEIIADMQESFDKEEYTDLTKSDISFHQYIVNLAGGECLVNIWYPIVIRMRMNYQRIKTSQALVDEHKHILEGIRNKDVKAATAALKKNIK
ncbi:GntR family transcriptional regulator [Catenovulum agarivorans DS-2]|uniref:GntR family transcriptional regulator n=1 Tax=Catenovulum agarivorans DS-2 TaxID=1328313 RepID=W7QZF3_9ALTE|nr:GntR family transcriptional regulator [Catenovulum agarivorans]EWH10740.1 GntR family transcriptional regulator [Catenovulum agarivorans DS-2]